MTAPLLDLTEYPESDGKPMTESDPTRDYLLYSVEALDLYFQSRRSVYVSGNLFIYYRQGDRRAVVSPDVFVVFGVSKRKRRSYQVWKEGGKLPAFVMEITSMTTKNEDEREKPLLYAQLGVQEYFQYDPTGDYLQPQLKGFQLVEGQYQPILPETIRGNFSIPSQVLGLDLQLVQTDYLLLVNDENGREVRQELRFFDPRTGEKLLTYRESEQARAQAEQAKEQAEQAKEQAEQARLSAIPRLLALGLTVEQVAEALQLSVEEISVEEIEPS